MKCTSPNKVFLHAHIQKRQKEKHTDDTDRQYLNIHYQISDGRVQISGCLGIRKAYRQTNNVWMLQLLEEGDLPDGGGGDPLILALQTDLLHRH